MFCVTTDVRREIHYPFIHSLSITSWPWWAQEGLQQVLLWGERRDTLNLMNYILSDDNLSPVSVIHYWFILLLCDVNIIDFDICRLFVLDKLLCVGCNCSVLIWCPITEFTNWSIVVLAPVGNLFCQSSDFFTLKTCQHFLTSPEKINRKGLYLIF